MGFKQALFNEANLLYLEAKEAYEIGDSELGADFENRFNMVLDELMRFGWDKEYMGID